MGSSTPTLKRIDAEAANVRRIIDEIPRTENQVYGQHDRLAKDFAILFNELRQLYCDSLKGKK